MIQVLNSTVYPKSFTFPKLHDFTGRAKRMLQRYNLKIHQELFA